MYDQEQIIQIYRQGFFICAGLSVVGGIMTTIFFWKFGIRRIIAVRTGYEARKEIRRIEEENSKKERKKSGNNPNVLLQINGQIVVSTYKEILFSHK